MKEEVEEERRWKKEGEGGIRRGMEWLKGGGFWRVSGREFLQSILGKKIFPEEGRKERAGREGKKTGGGG